MKMAKQTNPPETTVTKNEWRANPAGMKRGS